MKKGLVLLTLIVFFIIFSFPAMAIEIIDTEETPVTFGVGLETFVLYAFEISCTYNISERVAVQGIIGIPNDYLSFSGVKLMYRFAKGETRNYYLFGLGGVVSDSPLFTETSTIGLGWAVGLGVEYSPDYLPDVIRYIYEFGYMDTTILYYNIGFRVYF